MCEKGRDSKNTIKQKTEVERIKVLYKIAFMNNFDDILVSPVFV